MRQLDEQLEKDPTEAAVREMAELRIRNLQAFAELRSFNDNGTFLCEHPLLEGRSEIAELRSLLRRDPSEFLRQHRTALDNIKRYKGYLKRSDRKDHRQRDRERLSRHEKREQLFRLVLEERNNP